MVWGGMLPQRRAAHSASHALSAGASLDLGLKGSELERGPLWLARRSKFTGDATWPPTSVVAALFMLPFEGCLTILAPGSSGVELDDFKFGADPDVCNDGNVTPALRLALLTNSSSAAMRLAPPKHVANLGVGVFDPGESGASVSDVTDVLLFDRPKICGREGFRPSFGVRGVALGLSEGAREPAAEGAAEAALMGGRPSKMA